MSVSRGFVARVVALVVATAALSVGFVIEPPFANAAVRHRTLNDTRLVSSAPVTPGHAIDHFGVVADLDSPTGLDPRGATPYGEARFLVDDRWTPWQQLDVDGAQAEGQFTGSLIAVDHATAYQVRNLPQGAHNWRAAAINTTDGPVESLATRGLSEAHAAVPCRSRADWGADESITGWAHGDVRAFSRAQAMTVHHTAGSNTATQNYSATVRAILNYHVVTNGWSDIGYQYLIDRSGIVYEGRSAGRPSVSCLKAGGNGSDFAHQEGTELVVTGAHVTSYNTGNLGISLMGCFNTTGGCSGDTTVPAGSVAGLESLLAEIAARHSLKPQGLVGYVNPVSGVKASIAVIATHKDWPATSTVCPGDRLYVKLPTIRAHVAQKLGIPVVVAPAAPTNLIAKPTSTSRVTLTWTDTSSNEQGFLIERCTGSTCTAFAQIAKVAAGTRTYSNTGLVSSTTYKYRVRAYNQAVNSGYSTIASATTLRK